MKYIILHTVSVLKECLVGVAVVTSNVLNFFKSAGNCVFTIYQTESEASEGSFGAKITDEKISLSNSKIFGVKEIAKYSSKFAVFEPDGNFKSLGTGWIRRTNLNSNALRDYSGNAILLCSEKDFPADWRVAVINLAKSTIDFGEVIPVQILKSMEK